MIYVFSRDMKIRRMLLTVQSLSWKEQYNGIGTFSLVAQDTEENAAMLQRENIVHFEDYDGIIKDVSISGNTITANGYGLAQLLNQRTAYNDVVITSAESGAYSLVSSNLRNLDILLAEPRGFEETCNVTVENGGKIGEWVEEICSQAGLGFRVKLDERTFSKIFEIYKGNDLTSPDDPLSVAFSTARNNLAGLEIEDDGSEFANVAVVRGVNLQDALVLVIVGTAEGAERHEIFVDATSDPQKDEETEFNDEGEEITTRPAETDEEYRARLTAKGQEELQAHLACTNFVLTVQPEEYGKRYKLGDLVTCYSEKHGLYFIARISEVKYVKDTKKDTLELTLGEPKISLKRMVRLWQK